MFEEEFFFLRNEKKYQGKGSKREPESRSSPEKRFYQVFI